ncbi:hypothetical protein [Gymnodinialimonas ulvae]|uniref:hypothetical protein n=1 Tax=Gymnodinialimonas ulvae TaxID=3126504 RepID=UPI0030A29DA0
MTLRFPLTATLLVTLAAPALAQDISDMLNPRDMIAEMGLGEIVQRPGTAVIRSAPYAPVAEIAALPRDGAVLRSPRPVLRPSVRATHAPAPPPAFDTSGLLATMEDAAAQSPAGGNTLVIAGGDALTVSGANTSVIRAEAPAPRLTLWQRIFGR